MMTTQKKRALFVQASILTFLIGCVLVYNNINFDPSVLIYPVSFCFSVLICWFLWSWKKVTGSLFDPYSLFLIAAIIFNGGQVLLEVFRLNTNGILDGQFDDDIILKSIFLVLFGLSSLHFGALVPSISKNINANESLHKINENKLMALRKVGWGMILISFVPNVLVLRDAIYTVMSEGYFGLYQQASQTSFGATTKLLASLIVPGSLFLLAGSRGMKYGVFVPTILIFTNSLVLLFLGYRAWGVMPLISWAWLWHRCINPLPKRLLIISAVSMVLVIFVIIAEIRNLDVSQRSDINLVSVFDSIDNPGTASITEMGGTLRTIAHTIILVPSVRDYDMGIGYFYAFLTIVPNFWSELHPTIARGTPSTWLTETVEPVIAAAGGGLGYSFIAETYLNFGWFGGLITLGLFGYLFSKLATWASSNSEPAKPAMVASFMSFYLFFARGDLSGIVRPLFWYCLIPYFIARILSNNARS